MGKCLFMKEIFKFILRNSVTVTYFLSKTKLYDIFTMILNYIVRLCYRLFLRGVCQCRVCHHFPTKFPEKFCANSMKRFMYIISRLMYEITFRVCFTLLTKIFQNISPGTGLTLFSILNAENK